MRTQDASLHITATHALVRYTVAIACLLALSAWLPSAHAATVYRCVDSHGRLTFQDTPCPPRTRQTRITVTQQPLIGASSEHAANVQQSGHRAIRARATHATRRRARPAAMSWECRAADGEVFYRHTRCPGSIAGDGVVRTDYAARTARTHPSRRHDAWSRVSVHATRIPRAEACRRIHAASAAGRDGHLRDENVSAYARMTGRDPCDEP